MTPFVSLLRTTRDNARLQGRSFVGFVRIEANRWRRFVRVRTAKVTLGARKLFAPRAVERELLVRVDGTLRDLDGRVTTRLESLAPRARVARTKRTATKRKSLPATRPSGTNLIAGGRKAV